MEILKLHADGARIHLKSLEEALRTFKQNLQSNSGLSEKEKEVQLIEAKNVFLQEKRHLKNKLF